ncbi:NACHT domain-containing NTPase [Nostoc sp. T09]|uniref:NACHT domain-containing protein n=1 Tax=Nostoc sp. T09 TaxID=1932621 RepID=UPI00211B6918|nr:NACHT domain-containing NTPase [Nostoc sp. T09]
MVAVDNDEPVKVASQETTSDIDALVQEIREQVQPSIKQKYGTMKVLDMPQPIELTGERGIYTNVNILEKIIGRRRLDISELLQNSDPDHFDRFGLNRVKENRVPGIEAVQRHHKLMVLGKPGAGKTTFLKYLAMQCIEGQYLTNRVPLFITLKDFAEAPKQPDVLEYIAQKFTLCGVQDASVQAEQLLRQGRLLLLLDGLDEVQKEDTKRVVRQIRDISDHFHTNQFVITCRIAAKEYTFVSFTEVEVADFNKEQITIFAENWFRLSNPNEAKRFIWKLEHNKRIQELATSPLLLTLLCLVFAEKRDFPKKRSKLYQEGLRILLKKWDAKIFHERDHVYKNLSVQLKEDLLSQIALATFEHQNYFFEQAKVEAYITEFFHKLHKHNPDTEILHFDSEAILKSIEAQHGLLVERANGIYSFSHLTFQEYFAAKEIVATSNYAILFQCITDKRWREVFLLTVGITSTANDLVHLMKQKIDNLFAEDKKLQGFLEWLSKKANSVELSYKPVAVRAFYFVLAYRMIFSSASAYTRTREISFSFAYALDTSVNSDAIDFDVDLALAHAHDQACGNHLLTAEDLNFDFNRPSIFGIDSELHNNLEKLRKKLPITSPECFKIWWLGNGKNWAEQLRKVIIGHRNIGHDWQLNDLQVQLLKDYYYANDLLIECLHRNYHISDEVRQGIEDSLLLPMSELKNKN